MQKWEYCRIVRTYDFRKRSWAWTDGLSENAEERLNKLGSEGWELVSEYAVALKGGSAFAGHTTEIVFTLKRLIAVK